MTRQQFDRYMHEQAARWPAAPVPAPVPTTAAVPLPPPAARVPFSATAPPVAASPLARPPAVARRKKKRLPPATPSEEQLANFFRVVDSVRDSAIFRLMYHAGLRVSEIGLLATSDYSAKTQRLMVHRLHGSRSGLHPLNLAELSALKAWRKLRGLAPGPLFPSNQGQPLSRQRLDALVKHYAALAGWPAPLRHCHSFKHACCSHLLSKGFNVEQVQDWVGHANIQNTILYSRPAPSSREQMATALADWM
jgi:type 1 fimbriae regulatory protein FimB